MLSKFNYSVVCMQKTQMCGMWLLPLTLHNITLLYGGQRSYELKTTTAGTAMRIKVKRHPNRPDPVLCSKVIFVVG